MIWRERALSLIFEEKAANSQGKLISLANSPPMEGCPKGGVVIVRDSGNYFSLPYNPKLREKARELRKAGNLSEVLVWQQLFKGKFKGYDFDRQKIIGNYIADFYCTNCNVVIEIDGMSHEAKVEKDRQRDNYFESLGITVVRILAGDVLNRLNDVMEMLYNHPALRAPLHRRGINHPAPPEEGN